MSLNKLRTVLTVVALSVSGWAFSETVTYDPSLFVDVAINSGNPTTPYPQFLEYAKGKSLAKYNAEGVTHADMEKSGRDAYQIMSHRCRYSGDALNGVKYINFNNNTVAQNYGTFVSEGDGYMLLAAAIFADQATFNGLYLWIHDNRFNKVKRFLDGKMLRDDANCGAYLAGWQCDETTAYGSPCHSATDGDVDIAMAMLIAYKQWGETMMQNGSPVKDAEGNVISLKEETKKVVCALVDTVPVWDSGSNTNSGYLSGDIGIDGYTKRGNTWGECTQWRFKQTDYPWATSCPNLESIFGGDYIDYDAPAYYNEFWKWLSSADGSGTDFQINQFKRAEASADWITGQAYAKGYYGSLGRIDFSSSETSPTISNYVDGEDFRYAWRHFLNYMWHGDPEFNWDPATHQITAGTNSYNIDMAKRHAGLCKEPLASAGGDIQCTQMGASPDPGQPKWFGVSQIPQQWTVDGGIFSFYHTNYELGSSAGAIVLNEDLELLGDMYRQSDLTWDGTNTDVGAEDEERYIGSTPKYFHGWFRCLGLLTESGNLLAPSAMNPIANMKVYMSVDKTYAYQGDNVDYTVQYRNYGTLDAKGVVIKTVIDADDYDFVSATKGGTYDASTHTITWNIGTVTGFKTGGLAATIDSVAFRVNIKDTINPRVCLVSTISASNCDSWVSNEYPNHATYTMERNCVDILAARSLKIKKTASRTKMNPNDVVKFTVEFSNASTSDSWMNGGRKNVRLSYANNNQGYTFYQYYRFWNDAAESYIDLGNYRVSYFMYDAAAVGLYNASTNPTGWSFDLDNASDCKKYGWMPTGSETKFVYQKIPYGEDANGKWNQRLMIQFPSSYMAPSTAVYDHLNNAYQLHKGGYGPCFFRTSLKTNPAVDVTTRLADDWSYSSDLGISSIDGQAATGTMVTPEWSDYDNPGAAITNYSRHTCDPASLPSTYSRVLVEEFDGYTWRRIQGTGPLPGRECYDVTIVDTIPYELEFFKWIDSTALKDDAGTKIQATYTAVSDPKTAGYSGIVKWTIPTMLVGESDKLIYTCKARDLGCPDAEDAYYDNVAWISSKTDSPDSSKVSMMTTCAELPPVIDPQTELTKACSVSKAMAGDNVTYTVGFKNTEGTDIIGDLSDASMWQSTGTATPVWGSSVKLNNDFFFGPTYAYGTDVTLTGTLDNINNGNGSWYLLRYVSGTPGESDFQGVAVYLNCNPTGSNTLGLKIYDNATLVAEEGTSWDNAISYPSSGVTNQLVFKISLVGSKLYLYLNNQDDDWTVSSKDYDITAAGPGYVRLMNSGNGNNYQLSQFDVHTDYAFNIDLWDQLPDELGKATSISDEGVYDATKNIITWPTYATVVTKGMAPNDSITRTFDAEVLSCDKYITNYAYGRVNYQDTLTVANTIECGASTCALTSVTLSPAADTLLCAGDSLELKSTAKAKGTYLYQWYNGKTKVGKETKGLDSLTVSEKGDYWVKVTDTEDATCTLNSDTINVTFSDKPVTLLTDTGACEGGNIELTATEAATGYEYLWSDGSTANTLTVSKNGTYKVTVTNGACTVSDTAKVTFGSVTLKGGIFTLNGKDYARADGDTGSICPTDVDNTLAVSYTSDDKTYTWTSVPADAALTGTTSTVSISPTVTTTYYVSFTQECAAKDSFTVTIGKPMEVTVTTDTLCDSLKLNAKATGVTDAVYTWTKDGVTSTGATLFIDGTTDPDGTVSVVATATDACPSDPLEVTYSNVSMTLVTDGSTTVCPGKTATVTAVAETAGLTNPTYTYSWTSADGKEISATADAVLSSGTYTVTAGNGYCTKTATHTIAEGSGEVSGDLTINGVKIVGSGADRTYGTCGGELQIVADYVHDAGTEFKWTVDGEEQTSTTNSLTITPTAAATVRVTFVNECDAYDEFTITLLDSVKLITEQKKSCGQTELLVTSNVTGAAYSWITGTGATADTVKGKSVSLTIADAPTATGTINVQGTAAGYCDSKVETVDYLIDTLGVTLTGPATVCEGTTATLTAAATASDPTSEVTYAYASRPAGSTAAFTAITGTGTTLETAALTQGTEFEVTATAGTCTRKDTVTVGIGSPARDGVLTVNGDTVTATDKSGTKYTRTCGTEALQLAVSHTGTDYTWTKDGETAGTGAQISVQPTATEAHTEQYIVTYTNECPATDTLQIQVYPLAATADWTALAGAKCEGETAEAALTLTGYDATLEGSYIKWYKDGEELTAAADKTTLSLEKLTTAQSGTYSYEVSNGICTRPETGTTDAATLTVNAKVHLTAPAKDIVVIRGSDTAIALTVDPTTATLEWKEDGTTAYTGNPLQLTAADKDHSYTVYATAEGYCDDSATVNIKVDAKAVISLSTDLNAICWNGKAVLTCDTTGTGHLLTPADYAIRYFVLADGTYQQITGNGATITVTPTATSTYKAVAYYGTQRVESDPVEITVYGKATYTLTAEKEVCAGTATAITLTDLKPAEAEVIWSTGEAGTAVTVTPEQTTTYGFTISQNNNLCQQKDSVTVSTLEQVEITLTSDTFVCAGDDLTLQAKVSGPATFHRWYQGAEVVSTTAKLTVTPETDATYTFVSGNGVCDSVTADVKVTVSPLPVIDSIVKTGIKSQEVLASGGTPEYQYSVSPENVYQDSATFKLTTYGAHLYHVKDANGCIATIIDTLEAPSISIPTVITPNGDGTNDIFVVPSLSEAYPNSTITIYDRWGKKLVEYKASEGGWDGTYNGNRMPSTDYWYEISVDEIDKTYTGHFTLLNSK